MHEAQLLDGDNQLLDPSLGGNAKRTILGVYCGQSNGLQIF
jgi:hypothetical protein